MVKLQVESNRQSVQRRIRWLYPPLILVFLLLGARLWWLQILQGSEYALLAEHNRIRNIQVTAPRGPVFDRNRIPLVENRPSFNILLYREFMKDADATMAFAGEKLGIPREDLSERLSRSIQSGTYRPLVIKEDVGIDDISIVEAYRWNHPEIQLGPEPRRYYRFGKLAAHVLGYVGEVSDADLNSKEFGGVQIGDLVGRSGIERTYNRMLTGRDGSRQVMVDSVGRELGVVSEKEVGVGNELQLTLDLDLQARAENLLEGKVGTIVAMDPRNGEILAMAVAPAFDPNSFSTRISAREWNALLQDPDHPLQNRAIQNTYPPGSIFKLIMAEAGLAEGFIDDDTRVFCNGSAMLYDHLYHCWSAGGHGWVDLESAIAHSCNIYFYTLAQRMGIENISRHARELGLGESTGIDLPGERSGIPPSPEWKRKARGAPWYPGDTISVSIGQGLISATPLQMLRAVSAIASDGLLVTPHLFLHGDQKTAGTVQWPVRQLPITPANAGRIRAGMWESVNNGGTSFGAAIPRYGICGKTGTVQVISAENKKEITTESSAWTNHAWFAGFASRDNPEIAIVVFLEHGGGGGASAAPLARQMFAAYFEKMEDPDMYAQSAVRPARSGSVR
jgi:penicillin-binding protein 2